MERDKLEKSKILARVSLLLLLFQSKCIACIYLIGEVNELKKFNFSTSFNFESLKVNISFTDRNF